MLSVHSRPIGLCFALAFVLVACQEPQSPTAEDKGSATRPPVTGSLVQSGGTEVPAVPVIPVATPARPAAAPDLFMMTFNIRYANTGDGVNAWSQRKAQVYALIKGQDPDIIGFQEVLLSQLQDLTANVPGYTAIAVGRDDGKSAGEHSPIFLRASRFQVDTTGTFWFSDTPAVPGSKIWGNTIPRICTWARLVDRNTSKGFYLFNLHVDHLSQPSREKSMLLLTARIGEVKHKTEPVFVTGDFNAGESNITIRYMKGKATLDNRNNPMPFLDSFREYDSVSTAVATRHDFTGNTSADDKIDYIWILPRIKTVKAEIIRTHVNGLYPSDHFPVTAALTVPDWASTSIRGAW